MPELPEVEVARRNLVAWSSGHRVEGFVLADPACIRTREVSSPSAAHPKASDWLDGFVGHRLERVSRHGKRMAWRVGAVAALHHLGMTGRWVRRPSDLEPPRHGRLGLVLSSGETLWFVDTRRFGWFVPIASSALDASLRRGHGPDALLEPPSGEVLAEHCLTRSPIKTALLDQRRLAGLGNIHVVDALWRANIHPMTPSCDLSSGQWARLASEIPKQLAQALSYTTAEEVVYITDSGGENPFEVYGREGEPCSVCGALILQQRLGGRSTYWCPSCQERDAPAKNG